MKTQIPGEHLRFGIRSSREREGEVEPIGIEPTTSCMPYKRSPN